MFVDGFDDDDGEILKIEDLKNTINCTTKPRRC